jgi:phosphoglycerol transferase MdoB-like AlkP superfamily enzyme
MPANPRWDVLMTNYRQYDQLTLVLFGISVAAVLIGWSMLGLKTPVWQRRLYFGFLLLAYILIFAGCTYLIITGGQL